MASDKPKVFISYARGDILGALRLYEALEKADIDPWLDVKKLLPGTRWKFVIKAAIRSSDFVLVCLSQHSISKIGFFQTEQKEALDIVKLYPSENIYLIPVRLEECNVPLELLEFNWVDLFDREGLSRILQAIREEWVRRGGLWLETELSNSVSSHFASRRKTDTKSAYQTAPVAFNASLLPQIQTTRPEEHDLRPQVEVLCFGLNFIRVNGQLIKEHEWHSQKAKELFLFLLCHQNLTTKEEIMANLWPDCSLAKGTSLFHSNLYRVRRTLFANVIINDVGRYQLNPQFVFSSDLDKFLRAVRQANETSENGAERVIYLEEATGLYRGPFLQELYSDWCELMRMQLESIYIQSLSSLVQLYLHKGSYILAREILQRALNVDRWNEDLNEKLVKVLIKQGDKAAAEYHYRHFCNLLKQDMGSVPQKTFEQICVESDLID